MRYTKDINFWIWIERSNVKRLLNALQEFGMGSLGLRPEDLEDPKAVVQIGYAPNRIDILLAIETLDFEECYERRQVKLKSDLPVSFIGREDLYAAKRVAGRAKDLGDIEELKMVEEE